MGREHISSSQRILSGPGPALGSSLSLLEELTAWPPRTSQRAVVVGSRVRWAPGEGRQDFSRVGASQGAPSGQVGVVRGLAASFPQEQSPEK